MFSPVCMCSVGD